MIIRNTWLGAAAALALAGAAAAQAPNPAGAVNPPPASGMPGMPGMAGMPGMPGMAMPADAFITAAAQTDEYERQAGKMAASKGKNAKVKDFGKMMVDHHTKTTADLQAAIRMAGMPVPPPPPLKPDQQDMLTRLGAVRGDAFDKEYVQQQVMAHQEALQVMTNYSQGGDVPSLKMAATKTVPIVQQHLDMATSMQSAMR